MESLVGAVCVTYHPNPHALSAAIRNALQEVNYLVVVNNDAKPLAQILATCGGQTAQNLEIIEHGDNLGIAAALNAGIDLLIGRQCTHLLLLDQDSIIPPGMVAGLLKTMTDRQREGEKIAAVGPAFFNTKLGRTAPFIRFSNLGIHKIYGHPQNPVIEVHHLISSGSLINIAALQDIGLMEEGLFIDLVDTEWSFRALTKGYKLYGDSQFVMHHALGNTPVKIMNRRFINHTPLRHYYAARNLMHLLSRGYIPLKWRLGLAYSLCKAFVFYSLVPRQRLRHLACIVAGLRDGLSGRYGRIDKLYKP